MRTIFLLTIIVLTAHCNDGATSQTQKSFINFINDEVETTPKSDISKLKEKAKKAFTFCQSKQFNEEFCILIDYSNHSGIKRFFIWDFKKDSITHSCLVSHGCGNNNWGEDKSKDNPQFSNVDGSHCSSLGKYKIGERGYSNWGINIKYLMHGLETTNNNALKRQIVFHSWEYVSEENVYPSGTPEGWGCPAISNKDMLVVDAKLKNTTQPVLMWIFQ